MTRQSDSRLGAHALVERAGRAASVASAHAQTADRESRFPSEAIAALRKERLLGVQVVGLPAYLNNGSSSLGRHLRDIYSAVAMIHNERISSDLYQLLLITPSRSQLLQPNAEHYYVRNESPGSPPQGAR